MRFQPRTPSEIPKTRNDSHSRVTKMKTSTTQRALVHLQLYGRPVDNMVTSFFLYHRTHDHGPLPPLLYQRTRFPTTTSPLFPRLRSIQNFHFGCSQRLSKSHPYSPFLSDPTRVPERIDRSPYSGATGSPLTPSRHVPPVTPQTRLVQDRLYGRPEVRVLWRT